MSSPSPSILFGIDDPRLAILRQAPSETLVALIGEIVSPKLGCSLAFFALGMSQEFRKTEPPVFLELVFQVLRERMPNVPDQATPAKKPQDAKP